MKKEDFKQKKNTTPDTKDQPFRFFFVGSEKKTWKILEDKSGRSWQIYFLQECGTIQRLSASRTRVGFKLTTVTNDKE